MMLLWNTEGTVRWKCDKENRKIRYQKRASVEPFFSINYRICSKIPPNWYLAQKEVLAKF